MQQTSELYKEILNGKHTKECRLAVGEKDTPIADLVTFHGEDMLMDMSTSARLFSEETAAVGGCISAEISVRMLKPAKDIPRQGKLVPQVRITDGTRYSEWLSKGVFFVDTREKMGEISGVEIIQLTGYDALLKAEQDCPVDGTDWPATDIQVVAKIARFLGVTVDERTYEIMKNSYPVQYPGEYSCREVLSYIAAMYGGNFIMSDIGQLRLVALNSIPPETRYLITAAGQAITFGGVRILV